MSTKRYPKRVILGLAVAVVIGLVVYSISRQKSGPVDDAEAETEITFET